MMEEFSHALAGMQVVLQTTAVILLIFALINVSKRDVLPVGKHIKRGTAALVVAFAGMVLRRITAIDASHELLFFLDARAIPFCISFLAALSSLHLMFAFSCIDHEARPTCRGCGHKFDRRRGDRRKKPDPSTTGD